MTNVVNISLLLSLVFLVNNKWNNKNNCRIFTFLALLQRLNLQNESGFFMKK